jgi:hypothetical protein
MLVQWEVSAATQRPKRTEHFVRFVPVVGQKNPIRKNGRSHAARRRRDPALQIVTEGREVIRQIMRKR